MAHQNIACEPLASVIQDVRNWDASIAAALMTDYVKLDRICKTRGISVLLSDLPSHGKALDKALSSGFLTLQKTKGQSHRKSFEPKWFSALYWTIFDRSSGDGSIQYPYCIIWNADPTAVFFLRQLLYMYKKLEVDCPQSNVDDTSEAFFTIDESLREPSFPWDSHPAFFDCARDNFRRSPSSMMPFTEALRREHSNGTLPGEMSRSATLDSAISTLDSVSAFMMGYLPEVNEEDIVPKHGPGAVADLPTGSDKYDFPSWPAKLDWYFPEDRYAYPSELWALRQGSSNNLDRSEGVARLLAVPKTYDKPRLITSEPTAHQFLQQGLLRWLRVNMPSPLRRCIDFKSQAPSREAALRASKADNGQVTVDLSAASDRLSCWCVERVFWGEDLLAYLYAVRTPFVANRTNKEKPGIPVPLRKFAGQGNAVTFPLQSMIYAIVAISAVIASNNQPVTSRTIGKAVKRVRVFGDDIIIPGHALAVLDLILTFLQLKINVSKTHYGGKFRESCGMDAYDGTDVTPCYLRQLQPSTTGSSLTSWVDVCNNAYSSGLWNLSSAMEEKIPSNARYLIPVNDKPLGCLTLRTFCEGKPQGSRKRTNSSLHRPEILGLVPNAKQMTARRGGHRALHQYFIDASFRTSKRSVTEVLLPWSEGYSVGNRFNLKKRWVPIA